MTRPVQHPASTSDARKRADEQTPKHDYLTATLAGVLGNTTGILLSDLGEMYDVQDFLVGRSLMTHERIDPDNDVSALLLAQFPLLAEAEPPPLKRATVEATQAACTAWVWSVSTHTGYPTVVRVQRPRLPEGGVS